MIVPKIIPQVLLIFLYSTSYQIWHCKIFYLIFASVDIYNMLTSPFPANRCLSLFRGTLHSKAWYRLLHDPAVCTNSAHSHPVVGGILDQYRCHSSPSDNRSTNSAHHDYTEYWGTAPTSKGLIHQSHRCVDGGLSHICVCLTAWVCCGQCVLTERNPSDKEKQLQVETKSQGRRNSPGTGKIQLQ